MMKSAEKAQALAKEQFDSRADTELLI